jgi:hypothetical protein
MRLCRIRPGRDTNLAAEPGCGRDELRAMLRTAYVVYFRCERCFQVWSIAKPGEEFGT